MVEKLDLEQKFATNRVIRTEHCESVTDGINRRKETSIQPTSSLRNQFRKTLGNIGLGVGRFNVVQDPRRLSFRDQFETQDPVLGQIHVCFENPCIGTVQCFALEIRCKRTSPQMVILKRDIAVRGERSWQYRDESEHALERLIEDITHFILKVLSRHEGVEQILAESAFHGNNFPASAGDIRVEIEGFPKMIERISARTGATIEENANVGTKNWAESLEKPAMRIDFLLIMLLETEEHLARHNTLVATTFIS